jgi:DNA-3-methyladenine glycosylase
MFGQPGFSYVYFIYGMYHCFNIVTERDGFPAAVLIRAAEPIEGTESMRTRSPKGKSDLILSGPGKFCRSFGLTRDHSGVDLTGDTLYLTEGEDVSGQVVATGRVGIKDGSDLPYRLYQDDSKAVSGSR